MLRESRCLKPKMGITLYMIWMFAEVGIQCGLNILICIGMFLEELTQLGHSLAESFRRLLQS